MGKNWNQPAYPSGMDKGTLVSQSDPKGWKRFRYLNRERCQVKKASCRICIVIPLKIAVCIMECIYYVYTYTKCICFEKESSGLYANCKQWLLAGVDIEGERLPPFTLDAQ